MTLVNLLDKLDLPMHKTVNVVVMGASGKVEERLWRKTNYFEEVSNFFPSSNFHFYFVGPELSTDK